MNSTNLFNYLISGGLITSVLICNSNVNPELRPMHQEKKWKSHWVESEMWNPGDGFFSYGPSIYRQEDRPCFVFQQTTIPKWKLEQEVPYLLVIDGEESMQLLTEFSTEGHVFGVVTTGRFRSKSGCVGHFSHTYSQEEDANEARITTESIEWASEGKVGKFGVQGGRVFLARLDLANNRFEFQQLAIDLPPKDIIKRLTGMDSTSLATCNCLNDWWQDSMPNWLRSIDATQKP